MINENEFIAYIKSKLGDNSEITIRNLITVTTKLKEGDDDSKYGKGQVDLVSDFPSIFWVFNQIRE